mmetsp:Transcript_105325/g.164227  ORF Transcript_105325/g.164227 Transcript_105325/m.164227 type:complete len:473 (-) Transcript_105325:115-1533(-)
MQESSYTPGMQESSYTLGMQQSPYTLGMHQSSCTPAMHQSSYTAKGTNCSIHTSDGKEETKTTDDFTATKDSNGETKVMKFHREILELGLNISRPDIPSNHPEEAKWNHEDSIINARDFGNGTDNDTMLKQCSEKLIAESEAQDFAKVTTKDIDAMKKRYRSNFLSEGMKAEEWIRQRFASLVQKLGEKFGESAQLEGQDFYYTAEDFYYTALLRFKSKFNNWRGLDARRAVDFHALTFLARGAPECEKNSAYFGLAEIFLKDDARLADGLKNFRGVEEFRAFFEDSRFSCVGMREQRLKFASFCCDQFDDFAKEPRGGRDGTKWQNTKNKVRMTRICAELQSKRPDMHKLRDDSQQLTEGAEKTQQFEWAQNYLKDLKDGGFCLGVESSSGASLNQYTPSKRRARTRSPQKMQWADMVDDDGADCELSSTLSTSCGSSAPDSEVACSESSSEEKWQTCRRQGQAKNLLLAF